jgi:hypothetical protein
VAKHASTRLRTINSLQNIVSLGTGLKAVPDLTARCTSSEHIHNIVNKETPHHDGTGEHFPDLGTTCFTMKAWELSVWVLLALVCRACVRSSEAESQPAYHWPQFHRVHDSTWNATQRSLQCLTSTGGWQLNNSKVIIDNIYLHAPCPVFYGVGNSCNWTLDGNVLKYYWQPESRCEVQIRPFHASTMCSLMKDRGNMMIVGDSVSEGAVKSWHKTCK